MAGSATAAQTNSPWAVALATNGDIYITDTENNRIRKITVSTGIITTIAGTGTSGFSGDGGSATAAQLTRPEGIIIDAINNIYFCDYNNSRIRKITASTGIITTIAGTGTSGSTGDGGLATAASISSITTIALDASGNVYLAGDGNAYIRKITVSTGIITTIAGTGTSGFSGDGGLATAATFGGICYGLAVDASNNVYFSDFVNNRVRKITVSTGIITTIAGTGTNSSTGDGGLATVATLANPCAISIDATGKMYIAENGRIRQITSSCLTITITISPASLTGGTVGTAYSQTVTQTGLVGTPAWSVSVGTLPAGLSIAGATGVISGTPTTAGTASFTVSVTNDAGCTQTKVYSIAVACPTLVFTNTTATSATIGTPYSLNAGVTGNTASVVYSVSSALPAGLSLDTATGVISGTPTAITASATYVVTATQTVACFATQSYTFAVTPPCSAVVLGLASIPNATVGTPYSQTFTATGGTTGATYTFSTPAPQLSVLAGNGLTLSAAGVLSGTPNFSTSITFRVTATTTPNNCPEFKDYTFVINPNPATSVDNSLANLVKVSPNPSRGDFNVDFGTINMTKSSVSVYDAQGKVVFTSENNSNLMVISLEKFANGIYLLEVKTANGRITKRLSKN